MTESVKVLVVGPVRGAFKEFFEKIRSIDAKYGKFQALLCTGDFFGPFESHDQVDELLSGGLEVPLPMYISQGVHPLPNAVVQKVAESYEFCPNLRLLGDGALVTTPEGICIANLGGLYKPDKFASSASFSKDFPPLFTAHSINKLYTALGPNLSDSKDAPLPIDVLLTNHWPGSITQLCDARSLPAGVHNMDLVTPLKDVVTTTKPRYHFASQSGLFWERPPIAWDDGQETRLTRFISLGEFGNEGKKQRWFYAFNLPNTRQTQVARPKNATSDPFVTAAPLFSGISKRALLEIQDNYIWGSVENPPKRLRSDGELTVCRKCNQPGHLPRECPEKDKPPEGYVCRKCNQPGHYIRDCTNASAKKRNNDGNEGENKSAAKLKPDECWFCLSSPRFAKHLVIFIGTECYITLPKGQIHPTGPKHPPNPEWSPVPGGGHVLIVPVEHHSTLHTLPVEVKGPILKEIDRMKDALKKCFATYGAATVSFEVARLSGKGGHSHIQVLPIPLRFQDTVAEEFMKTGIAWSNDPDQALIDAGTEKSSYFRVDLPDGHKMVHIIKGYFDLQFGRLVMARVLGLPERADWKACALSEEEDTRDAEVLKETFSPFDPFR